MIVFLVRDVSISFHIYRCLVSFAKMLQSFVAGLFSPLDGIFDEFTYSGVPLNLTALLCIHKTALGWTADSSSIQSEGADNFFQKYLYMGVYPMAPFPGNDH